jgi:RNA ligase (TIGR02306 family)
MSKTMSTFAVPVVRLASVTTHPNADRLDVARIGGYQMVVAREQFRAGDLVVYIPEQALVPLPLLAEMGLAQAEAEGRLKGKCAGPEGNRVKAVQLRGVLSQGLAYRPVAWPDHWVEGLDVAAELGIEKWEPPIPIEMAGQVVPAPAGTIFSAYTDIDDWKKRPERIPAGTPVAYTHQYHGTNLAVYIFRRDGVEYRGVTSLGVARRLHGVLVESATNLYWRAARAEDLFAKLDAYMRDAGLDEAMLFGEVLGVQDLRYGLAPGQIGVVCFDLKTPGGYLDHAVFRDVCARYGIPAVAMEYEGPHDFARLDAVTNGPAAPGDRVREGVVIRPLVEQRDDDGRIIQKSLATAYLLRAGGPEYH